MLSNILKDSINVPKTFSYRLNNNLITLADEEEACTKPEWAYEFAIDVSGANIEKCQEAACKSSYWAYWFAKDIPGADIEKCQEAVCKDPFYAYNFAKYIPGADKEKCREACKGSIYDF